MAEKLRVRSKYFGESDLRLADPPYRSK